MVYLNATHSDSFKILRDNDTLHRFREEFIIPTNKTMKASTLPVKLESEPCVYLCGNSLGLLPKRAKKLVEEELEVWGARAVEAHFDHPHHRDWMYIADLIHPLYAELVGSKESEVACMGSLTANLHLLMDSFYKPTKERYKILCEARAFPSDQYAIASQVQAHGFSPSEAIIEMAPREGEFILRKNDILETIANEGSTIALVLFSGCQYYTGQVFGMKRITEAAQDQGCVCGWDLAHAVGNVPLSLHDWNVDFAVWCTYKYLNSGPGGIGGLFVHERWATRPTKHAGWWGHDPTTRFLMPSHFSAIPGAQGFQMSNPSVLSTVSLLGSLQVFHEAGGMQPLRARSLRLTGYLESLLHKSKWWIPLDQTAKPQPREDQNREQEQEQLIEIGPERNVGFTIITPSDPESRGSQLSLLFVPMDGTLMPKVMKGLGARGVIGDSRKPDVIRLAPCALYNTFEDVERGVQVLEEVLDLVARDT